MRIVFMGTPEFAATILEDLSQQHDVVAVYTRPDAVRGRGKTLEASPVKRVAERLGLEVLSPRTLRDEAEQRQLAALKPEVICVAAYGAILPAAVLEIPPRGCLNVHASLLPRWRGAAPIERAILAGDEDAGVCVMRMEEGLDTGDYCVCRTAHIEGKTTNELTDELANLGSHALLTALVHVQNNAADWTMQDETHVTYASKIEKGELDVSPQDTAELAVRKVRASSSAHPSRTIIAERAVTVQNIQEIDDERGCSLIQDMAPAQVRFAEKRLFLGVCGGAIELLSVKPDGKPVMNAKAFAAGIQNIKTDTLSWGVAHG